MIGLLIFLVLWIAAIALVSVAAARAVTGRDVPQDGLATGEELVRRIMARHELKAVKVQAGDADCYLASQRTIQLADGRLTRGSVSAIAIAAHECAHTLQHADSYTPWKRWWVLSGWSLIAGLLICVLVPLAVILGFTPLLIAAGVLFLVTLLAGAFSAAVEADAVRLALLELDQEELSPDQRQLARQVLNAARAGYIAETLFDVGWLGRRLKHSDR